MHFTAHLTRKYSRVMYDRADFVMAFLSTLVRYPLCMITFIFQRICCSFVLHQRVCDVHDVPPVVCVSGP